MRSVLLDLALASSIALVGCSAQVRVRAPTARVRASATSARATVAPMARGGNVTITTGGTEVRPVDSHCAAGEPEVCNGLDDNCDGVIDEGCGFQTGNIQITLAWANTADLDLYVIDPSGFEINYLNRESPNGGHLDHDARGGCERRQTGNTIENVYWDSPNPPSGQYRVEVHYWGECGQSGPTEATLSVAVGGQILGAYHVLLQPRDRQAVVMFTMP
ncbi:MAG: hypothetical protein AB7S26_24860 [Sandaracinaceae bacterium]